MDRTPFPPPLPTASAHRPSRPAGWIKVLCCLTSLTVLAGCYSFSTLQEPQTLQPGGVRVAPKVRVQFSDDRRDVDPGVSPSVEVDVRVGILPRLELQVGAGTSPVARAGLKALLIDWDALTLAVVPTYQIQHTREDSDSVFDEDFLPSYRTQTFVLPLIAGIPLASSVDLLLGGDAHAGRRHDPSIDNQSGGFLSLGAHLGFAVHAGKHATLVPQCGVLATVASTPTPPSALESSNYGNYEVDDLRRGHIMWECALGGSFGGRYASRDTK